MAPRRIRRRERSRHPDVQRGSPETVLESRWRADRPINDGSFVLVGRMAQPLWGRGAAIPRASLRAFGQMSPCLIWCSRARLAGEHRITT